MKIVGEGGGGTVGEGCRASPYGRDGAPLGEMEGARLLPREKLAKIFDF